MSATNLTIRQQERLQSQEFWTQHDVDIIQTDNFVGQEFFYPIYRYENFYSFSALNLIRHKGVFKPNPAALQDLAAAHNDVSVPGCFIDAEIERVGGPPKLTGGIKDIAAYTKAMATAMQADIAEAEANNPGYTNYILCGGRDSLNMLLADWKNPTIVLSAAPNFTLVQDFVAQNNLGYEVIELIDTPPDYGLEREIAEACLQVNLEHWKWSAQLVALAQQADHKAIFWKGQFADSFLTDYWRSYTYRRGPVPAFLKRVWRRMARVLPDVLSYGPDQWFLADYAASIWQRGAVGQGAHLGYLRALTGCLCLSCYHGPRTAKVWLDADLRILAKQDLRPEIGATLHGGPVRYPSENPAPDASAFRAGHRTLEAYQAALRHMDIAVP